MDSLIKDGTIVGVGQHITWQNTNPRNTGSKNILISKLLLQNLNLKVLQDCVSCFMVCFIMLLEFFSMWFTQCENDCDIIYHNK